MPAIRLVLRSKFPCLRNSVGSFAISGPGRRDVKLDPDPLSSGDGSLARGFLRSDRDGDSQQDLFVTHDNAFELNPHHKSVNYRTANRDEIWQQEV